MLFAEEDKRKSVYISSQRQPHLDASLPTALGMDIGLDLPQILNGAGKLQKNTFISQQILQIGAKADFWKGFAAQLCPAGSLGMAAAAPWLGHPSANTNLSAARGFHSQGVMALSSLRRKGPVCAAQLQLSCCFSSCRRVTRPLRESCWSHFRTSVKGTFIKMSIWYLGTPGSHSCVRICTRHGRSGTLQPIPDPKTTHRSWKQRGKEENLETRQSRINSSLNELPQSFKGITLVKRILVTKQWCCGHSTEQVWVPGVDSSRELPELPQGQDEEPAALSWARDQGRAALYTEIKLSEPSWGSWA